MTLELKQYKSDFFNNSTKPYRLGGVKSITSDTIYGKGYFAITIFDTKVFLTDCFEYVKDADSGKFSVKMESGVPTMTDNEIIKALECCKSSNDLTACWKCPALKLKDNICGDCSTKISNGIMDATLDLINRQKAEIETAKAKAIREFAEKFKSTLENLEANSPNKTYQTAMQDMLDYYVPKIIDNLVKEMTEGGNGYNS